MWSSLKTEGIILSVGHFREADRRYSALTPALGKIEFIGRGARKGKAKVGPHLDPFAIIDLEIIKGARGMTVIGAERKHAFRELSESFDHRILAGAAAALLDKIVRPELEDFELYTEYRLLLQFLNDTSVLTPARTTFVLGGFLLRMLSMLGYEIELSRCLACKGDILPLSFRWHDGHGGLVCTNCVLATPSEWVAARALEEEIITLMRFARDASYADYLRPALRSDHVGAFAMCVNDLMRHHVPGYGEEVCYWHLLPSVPVAVSAS